MWLVATVLNSKVNEYAPGISIFMDIPDLPNSCPDLNVRSNYYCKFAPYQVPDSGIK